MQKTLSAGWAERALDDSTIASAPHPPRGRMKQACQMCSFAMSAIRAEFLVHFRFLVNRLPSLQGEDPESNERYQVAQGRTPRERG